MKNKKVIGLYGGSFNPIHHGHLHLALSLYEIHGLTEVWFIPAKINPFKQNEKEVSFSDRAKMVELALENLPFFKLETIENELPTPSYTIQTIEALLKREKGKKLLLLLGEDSANALPNWKDPEKLIERIPLLIGSRVSEPSSKLQQYPNLLKAVKEGMTKIPTLEISSSELRERLKNNLFCDHLMPKKVIEYAKMKQIY